jgi:uncharacterized protein
MLTEPLPATLDIRKATARGVSISGALKPLDLPRFRALLAADEGDVQAALTCSRDEEGHYLVEVAVEARVRVICQRCLEPLVVRFSVANTLAAVWGDEQARHLPRSLDPLLLTGETCLLWDLVEDELILGLPAFNYHEQENCNEVLVGLAAAQPERAQREDKPNPFDVLAQLKPGNKH